MINQLLRLFLGQCSFLQVALQVDVEEGGDASDGHGGAVLGLDRCQIAEVEPLYRFLCVIGRFGDVEAVDFGHLLHAFEGTDLFRNLFALADDIVGHGAVATVGKIIFLLFDQIVDAIESYAAVVADNSSAAVGVGQAGDDVAVAGCLHFGCISVEHSLVVRLVIFGKDLVELVIDVVAVGFGGFFRHLDAAIGHEGALQGLVRLEADDLFQILEGRINIAGSVGGESGNNFRFAVEDAAFGAFLFLESLYLCPEFVGALGRSFQKGFVAIIGCVVVLDKVADVDVVLPVCSFE